MLSNNQKNIIKGYYDIMLTSFPHVASVFTKEEIKEANSKFRKNLSIVDSKIEEYQLKLKSENVDKLREFGCFQNNSIIEVSSFIVNPDFDVKTEVNNRVFREKSLHDGILVLKHLTGVFINQEGNASDIKNTLIGFAFDKDKYENSSSKSNRGYIDSDKDLLFKNSNESDAMEKAAYFYKLIVTNPNMRLAIKVNKYQLADGVYRLQEEAMPIDMNLYAKVYKRVKDDYISKGAEMTLGQDIEIKNRVRDMVFQYTVNNKYTPLVKTSRTISNWSDYVSEFEDKYNYPLMDFVPTENSYIRKYEFRTDRRDMLILDNRKIENSDIICYAKKSRK